MKMNKSLKIIGLFIILVIVLVVAYYKMHYSVPISVNTSEPYPTNVNQNVKSDWLRYTNKTYQFELYYPPTLMVASNGDFAADLIKRDVFQEDLTPADIKVRISVYQNNRNFEKIFSAPDNSIIPEEQHAVDATFTKVENRIIYGSKAVDYTYNVPSNQSKKSYTKGIIINKNGALIEVSSWNSETVDLDEIVNTIQFIPPSAK